MKRIVSLVISTLAAAQLAAQVPAHVPTNDLLQYYPFENRTAWQGSDVTINHADVMTLTLGNSSNSYFENRKGRTTRVVGANPFQTGNNYMFISSYEYGTFDNLTVSVWAKFFGDNGTLADGNTYTPTVVTVRSTGSPLDLSESPFGISLRRSPGDDAYTAVFSVYYQTSGGSFAYEEISSPDFPVNEWQQLVLRFDGDNGVFSALLNNQEIASSNAPGAGALLVSPEAGERFFLTGMFDGNTFSSNFNGVYDDLGLWTRALSDDEITRLYEESTEVLYLPLDGESLEEFAEPSNGFDAIGGGIEAALGTTEIDADRAKLFSPLSSSSMIVPGDAINANGNIPLINFRWQSFTYAAWVNLAAQPNFYGNIFEMGRASFLRTIASGKNATPFQGGFADNQLNGDYDVISSPNYEDPFNRWFHVVFTTGIEMVPNDQGQFFNMRRATLYIDGVEVANVSETLNTLDIDYSDEDDYMSIGTRQDSPGFDMTLFGRLEELYFTNKFIDACEAAELYSRSKVFFEDETYYVSGNAASYVWTNCDGTPVATIDSNTFSPEVSGFYQVQLEGECVIPSECLEYTAPVSVTNPMNESSNAFIYPNPSNGLISIHGVGAVDRVVAFDLNGRLAGEYILPGAVIDTQLSPGVYIILAEHEGKVVARQRLTLID